MILKENKKNLKIIKSYRLCSFNTFASRSEYSSKKIVSYLPTLFFSGCNLNHTYTLFGLIKNLICGVQWFGWYSIRLWIKRLLVGNSPESLCYVHKQDTLSAASQKA